MPLLFTRCFNIVTDISLMKSEELCLLCLDMVLCFSNKSGYGDRLYRFSFVYIKFSLHCVLFESKYK
jgi:hypothetical protein